MRRTMASVALGLALAPGLVLPRLTHGTAFHRVPGCLTRQLRITAPETVGGLGHDGNVLHFTNRGRQCFLRGYPGVDALSTRHRLVLHVRRTRAGYLGGLRTKGPIPKIILGRGRTGTALLEGLGAPPSGRRCSKYRFLRITPPDQRRSVTRRIRYSVCYPEIHPVVRNRYGTANPPRD